VREILLKIIIFFAIAISSIWPNFTDAHFLLGEEENNAAGCCCYFCLVLRAKLGNKKAEEASEINELDFRAMIILTRLWTRQTINCLQYKQMSD
jgi:hypothetical protein